MINCLSVYLKLHRNVRNVNESCDSGILEGLDLPNLAIKAATSEHCSNVAAGIFGRKFATKLIRFGNEQPAISDLETASNILRYFGHLIRKISLQFTYNSGTCTNDATVQNRKLLSDINKYCRNSLVDFEIRYSDCDPSIFSEIKGPFDKAENVSIHLFHMTAYTDKLKLNEIFPRVRHLELDFDKISDPNFVDGEFRYMDEIAVASGILDESFDEHFKGFLKKNPQIRYVSVVSPIYRTFHHLFKQLKNLQELHIQQSIREDRIQDKIFFPNIKRLDIRLAPEECVLPKRITFGRALEEITLQCQYIDIGTEYFSFLDRYKKIKKLSAGIDLNNKNLLALIGKYPLLSEATFTLRYDVLSDTIIKFVKKSNRLNLLHFYHSSNENREDFKKKLEAGLGNDFRVHYFNTTSSSEYLIERKVPVGSASTLIAFNAIIAFIVIFLGRTFFF